MPDEPIRRRVVTLRQGDQIPVDDVTLTVDRLTASRVELAIEATKEIPIGRIRRAGEAN